jgi:hypothetical protein
MPALTIHIKKHTDGTATLTCARADGTTTWQRQRGAQGAFFPLHDLTHYAVEAELGVREGFYGLVASGWDLIDFGTGGSGAPIPDEALAVESIVGMLDTERALRAGGHAAPGFEEINAQMASHYAARGHASPAPTLTDDELARVRVRRAELFEQWAALPDGGTLTLGWS